MADDKDATPVDPKLAGVEKRRSAAESWVNRSVNALKVILDKPARNTDQVEIESALKQLNERFATYETVQAEYEVLLDEDDLEVAIDTAFSVTERVKSYQDEVKRRLMKLSKDDDRRSTATRSHCVEYEQEISVTGEQSFVFTTVRRVHFCSSVNDVKTEISHSVSDADLIELDDYDSIVSMPDVDIFECDTFSVVSDLCIEEPTVCNVTGCDSVFVVNQTDTDLNMLMSADFVDTVDQPTMVLNGRKSLRDFYDIASSCVVYLNQKIVLEDSTSIYVKTVLLLFYIDLNWNYFPPKPPWY